MRDSKSGVCNIGVRVCYEDNVGIVGAYGWIGRLDSHVSRSFGYNEYERLISAALGCFFHTCYKASEPYCEKADSGKDALSGPR